MMSHPTAGILSTGTEILQGLYPDTNAQWLSQQLATVGLPVTLHQAAPDDANLIIEALLHLSAHCDVVIMTGGLGPTEDDLTRQAVSEVFGVRLAENAKAWAMIEERFARRSTLIPKSNRVQCFLPEHALPFYNEWGTAPGFCLEEAVTASDQTPVLFAALPGPPREMKPMFTQYLKPILAKRYGGSLLTCIRVLHTFGVSESLLNDQLRALSEETRDDPNRTLAFLAGEARVDLRLTVHGQMAAQARQRLDGLVRKVRRLVPTEAIYGTDDDTLESVVGHLLCHHQLTLAVAESCTGGLVMKRLTDVPGSSGFLREGWVTYSQEAKRSRLGVNARTLQQHGAVSPEVARQMARGALKKSGADVAVALTGIAGPSGGTPEKPVGLVWHGLAWRADAPALAALDGAKVHASAQLSDGVWTAVTRTCFTSGRDIVRHFASHHALDSLRRLVSGIPLQG